MKKLNGVGIIVLSIVMGSLLFLPSCEFKKVEQLRDENARLKAQSLISDSIQVEFLNAYAEIEYNISKIKNREKMITENSYLAEGNTNIQERILNDIAEIGQLMEENRTKLRQMESLKKQLIAAKKENVSLSNEKANLSNENASLKKQLSEKPVAPVAAPVPVPVTNSKANDELTAQVNHYKAEYERVFALNKSLEETIQVLKNQIAESEATIENLREELAVLKDAYAALQEINEKLQTENETYKIEIQNKDAEIVAKNSQIEALNDNIGSAYYIVATAKILKQKKIVLKNEVSTDIKDSDFTRIQNMQEENVIETKSSKIDILTKHPGNSYKINAKDKKNLKIEITNPTLFWKYSRYLVVSKK